MGNSKVLGIDLGTTNSCVAIIENKRPVVIPNKGGYNITPSVVAFTESGERLVGQLAKRQAISNPDNTIYASKRLIGRKWDSPEVRKTRDLVSYKVIEGPHNDVRISIKDRSYSLPEISAMVLLEMKKVAEDYLGQPANQVVITVPAYFNDGQRQATKDAGTIAGLDVLRIINEPTAAALAYGYGKEAEKRIAVYDLGGGTFDISILEISNGVFEVICTAGDTFLGGEDFDACIIDHIAEEFLASNPGIDLRKDKMALQRMKEAAEKAKIDLSSVETTEVSLPFIYSDASGAKHLRSTVSRTTFESLIQILINKTIDICRKTLELANLAPKDIDDLLLVGGSTRIPMVQRKVSEFYGKEPSKGVHPDEVVAIGAAVQGAALVTDQVDALLLDVTPHSLGISTKGGFFSTLIKRNTTVPTQKSHIFTTAQDNQKAVKITVFQGENKTATENELLGEFLLDGIAPAPAGKPEIEVSFSIDSDGIVHVGARDLQTGKSQSITVVASSGLTPEEIKTMAQENQEFQVAERAHEENLKSGHALHGSIKEVETLLNEKFLNLSESLQNKTVMVLNDAKNAVEQNDETALRKSETALKRILEELNKS